MNHTSKTTAVWARGLTFVTVFSLCACSVLEINVDEYKGSLSNHEDIQLQQYAALAISAKPIIVELRSHYISDEINKKEKIHDQLCEKNNYDEYSGCRFQLEIVQFLNSILALYEDEEVVSIKEKTESLKQENLASAERRRKTISARLERNKWDFFAEDKGNKQNVYKTYIDSVELDKQIILGSNDLCEQGNLIDIEHEKQVKLTAMLHGEQAGLKTDVLDALKSFIRESVEKSKGWGGKKATDIANFKHPKGSGDGGFKKYDCTQAKNQVTTHDNARDAIGINRLATNFIDSINKASASPNEDLKNEVRIAKERLSESLILFAEKILFIVNNHSLAFGNGTTNYDDSANNYGSTVVNGNTNYDKPTDSGYAKKFAVLQSLGNTLIVHANDLRRHAEHEQRLKDRKDSELAAAQHAFAPGAQSAFDNLVRDLEVAIQLKGSRELILAKAISEFDKRPIKKEDIDKFKTTLETGAQTVQPTLNAYRTAFGDYEIEGVIPAEDSSAVEDRREIAGLFKKDDPKKVRMDDVFTKLESWFDDSKITPQGELPPADSKYNRRNCAKTAFDKFKSKLFQQDFEVVGTETELFKKLGDRFLVKLNEDKLNLKKTQKEIADKEQALAANEKNRKEQSTVAGNKSQLENTLKTVKSIKQAVLQQAEIAKVDDFSGLHHLLLLELKKQDELTAEPNNKINFLAAYDVLSAMSIPKSFHFVGGSSVTTQRDVLDDVIAQLQQQRLEAASRGGDITALNKALELAYEQRGGLSYLRSANAYLRNAFANTSLQDGNDSCRNLLTPSIFCQDGYDQVFKKTKLEIDKQFWQTINTIKVRGGGATDFAIVKDDVGNWYVKGLTSNPESIIKSAQSLALFNMGGKVNLNLLGQVQDRRELAKLKIDDPRREYLQNKLDEKQSGSGANTSALGKVLDKYRKEYVAATITDVSGLIGKLDQLPIDINAAWQGINFDKDTLEKLKALLNTTPAELVTAKAALTDLAKADPQASTTPPKIPVVTGADLTKTITPAVQDSSTVNANASNAIVKSLIEVRNMRSRLVKAIIQNDDLITTQRAKYIGEKAKLDAQDIIVTDKKIEWEKANAKVTVAQALFNAMTAPTKREALTAAEQTLKVAQDALNKAHAAQEIEVATRRKTWGEAVKLRKDAEAENPTDSDNIKLGEAKTALENAEKALDSAINIPSEAVTTQTKARDKAESERIIQQGIFDGLTASSEVESARGKLTAATEERGVAKSNLDEANKSLTEKNALAKSADDAYTLAKSNRLAAARKVSVLANSLIETTTTNRLEAVKAYEVAIGFVGQTAGGQ